MTNEQKVFFPATNKRKQLLFFALVALLLIHVIFTFAGLYFNDDLNYARYASNISRTGILNFKAADHFGLRWTTIFATAFFYKIGGINEVTSALFSFFSIAFCGFLIFRMNRNKPAIELFVSLVLFFFCYSIIFYAHRLLPDAGMCFFIFLTYYFYYRQHFENEKNSSFQNGLFFSLSLFISLVTKETIIILIPLLIYLFTTDIIKKRNFIFWLWASGIFIVLVSSYLLYFKLTTGEYFYRYALLQKNNFFNQCSYDKLPFIDTIDRLIYRLWRAMLLNGDMLVLIPAICAILYKKKLILPAGMKHIISCFLILLVSSNFMSISFRAYVPLCEDPRHFLFLIPFAAISGAPVITAFYKGPRKYFMLPLLFLLSSIIMILLGAHGTKYMYFLLTLLFLGHLLFSILFKRLFHESVFFAVFIGIFFINYLSDFIKPKYPFYFDQKEIVINNFKNTPVPAIVYSSSTETSEISEFILKFNTGNVFFKSLDDSINLDSNKQLLFYYLVNRITDPLRKQQVDFVLNNPMLKSGIVLVEQKNDVFLYQLKSNELLQYLR